MFFVSLNGMRAALGLLNASLVRKSCLLGTKLILFRFMEYFCLQVLGYLCAPRLFEQHLA